MSWSAYVKNLEDGPAKCTYAGFFGRAGGVWGESENKGSFPITEAQVLQLMNIMACNDQNIYANGLSVGGVKFTCLGLEPDVVLLQGKNPNLDFSLVIAMTNSAIIVGFNNSAEIKTQTVRTAVEGLKDFLKNAGY